MLVFAMMLPMAIACSDEPETVETVTVSFDSGGGSEVAAVTLNKGEKLAKPTDPQRDGYTFDGWYNGEGKWSFSAYYAEEDMTLTARWIIDNPPEIKHTVSFDSDGAGEYPRPDGGPRLVCNRARRPQQGRNAVYRLV